MNEKFSYLKNNQLLINVIRFFIGPVGTLIYITNYSGLYEKLYLEQLFKISKRKENK